jgi:hypothetical protein
MTDFDYTAPAEVFACSRQGRRAGPVTYRRFGSVAEAIRFTIEDLSATELKGTVLEVNERRFDALEIRGLYDSDAYPLERKRSQ